MRIFADGVFDFYHKGHREHFERFKNIEDDVDQPLNRYTYVYLFIVQTPTAAASVRI